MSNFRARIIYCAFQLYKNIPFPIRTKFHRFLDFLNEHTVLLAFVGPVRHRRTTHKILSRKFPQKLIVGESYKRAGWFVTNYQVTARNFLDVRKPFSGGSSLTHVYADNVIEHLKYGDAELFLKNAYDALMPGGKIRIATPDTEAIARAYLEGDVGKTKELASDLKEHNLRIVDPIDMLHVTFNAFGHFKGRLYDQDTLTAALRSSGFKNIRRFPPGISTDVSLMNLEKRIGESDSWGQLCLEAQK